MFRDVFIIKSNPPHCDRSTSTDEEQEAPAADLLFALIEWAYLSNLTEAEIVKTTGCSTAMVHRHLRRRLREKWGLSQRNHHKISLCGRIGSDRKIRIVQENGSGTVGPTNRWP